MRSESGIASTNSALHTKHFFQCQLQLTVHTLAVIERVKKRKSDTCELKLVVFIYSIAVFHRSWKNTSTTSTKTQIPNLKLLVRSLTTIVVVQCSVGKRLTFVRWHSVTEFQPTYCFTAATATAAAAAAALLWIACGKQTLNRQFILHISCANETIIRD